MTDTELAIFGAFVGFLASMVTPMEWAWYRRIAGSVLMSLLVLLLAIIASNIKDLAQ